MKRRLYFCLTGVVISLFLLASCVEDIDMDTGEELPVVVDCVLKMDTLQTLRLYHMKPLNANGYEPVTEAKVELQRIQKNGSFFKVAEFQRSEGFRWETRFKPDFGEKYRLSVTLPGKEEISATTTFPEDLRLVLRRKAMKDGTGRYDSTRDTTDLQMITAEVATASMVTEEDFLRGVLKGVTYYENAPFPVKAYLPTGSKACKMWIYPRRDSIIVYPPNNRPEYRPPFTFSDLPFIPSQKPYCDYVVTDHPYADNFNLVPGKVTDLDIVNVPVNSMEKIDKVYMDYGGIYRLISTSKYLLNYTQWIPELCPDLPLHKGFVRIDQPEGFSNGLTDEDFKTSYLSTSGSFLILGDYSDYLTGVEPFLIEVRFLSDEYDAFLRDLHVRNLSRDNFVLSTYDSNNIYSNISGGVGVFGAENTTWAEEACKKSFPYSLIIF